MADTPDYVDMGVLIYRSKQSEDQCPKVLISEAGNFAKAAVVAAPTR